MGGILSRATRVAHRLGSKLLLALGVLYALTLVAGVALGRHWAGPPGADPKFVERLQSKLSETDAALKAARGELEMQRTRHEVDRRALELLRGEMAAEKVRTAELEEGLSFYRSMVVSDDTAKGLSLRKPELVPGDNPSRIKYRIFVQQKDREYDLVEGRLMAEVVGVSGGREVTYPLAKLSKEFNDKSATLQFRYFQSIEGEITLPDGFEPKEMKLTVRARKPREMAVKELFPWALQERFINVGE